MLMLMLMMLLMLMLMLMLIKDGDDDDAENDDDENDDENDDDNDDDENLVCSPGSSLELCKGILLHLLACTHHHDEIDDADDHDVDDGDGDDGGDSNYFSIDDNDGERFCLFVENQEKPIEVAIQTYSINFNFISHSLTGFSC